ncbi:DUF983 domain-containing protein [Aequorivita echinoideorum]|uniref:DUF983 domain-containing protein n=2 Tax=Aequorivita echinoideorum TaxID=1549647 RepID=A0ABS5S2W2_9FLAO|nr:DUF983 domain-containing protein [Aequorivita echinoideorum]
MQFLKGTKIYSIFTGTCPVCQEGKMYLESNPYKFSETLKMRERCPNCNIKFSKEPSFFYGAMYVSYAVGVAIAIAAFIISFFFLGLNQNYSFLVIILTLIVLFPIILRLSRNIWINFFFKFNGKLSN